MKPKLHTLPHFWLYFLCILSANSILARNHSDTTHLNVLKKDARKIFYQNPKDAIQLLEANLADYIEKKGHFKFHQHFIKPGYISWTSGSV